MIVDPAIAALRSDPASQRRLRAQMDTAHASWRQRQEVLKVVRDLAWFAEGQPLDQLSALAGLLASLEEARKFVDLWLADFAECLSAHPLAQLPMQHHHSDGLTTMQLASAGGAALSLSVFAERETYSAADSAVFADREMHDLVLYGEGMAQFHQLREKSDGVRIETARLSLSAGSRKSCVGDRQTRQIERVTGRLVALQLSRVPDNPGITREYALGTAQLLQQSSGDKRASQQEMAMAVLSAMGRSDAAPLLADITKTTGAAHLRWEAMRHALFLDAEAGVRVLSQMADATGDPLADPANELLAQLHATYPQLTQREAA